MKKVIMTMLAIAAMAFGIMMVSCEKEAAVVDDSQRGTPVVNTTTSGDSTSTFVYDDTLRSKWRCTSGMGTITLSMYNNHYRSEVVGFGPGDNDILFEDGEDVPFMRAGDTLYLLDLENGFDTIRHGGPAWYVDTVAPNKCIWEYIGYLPAMPIVKQYTFQRM